MSTSVAGRMLPDRRMAETLFTDKLSMLVCVCSVGVCSYMYLCMGVGVYLCTWAFCVGVSTFDCFECISIQPHAVAPLPLYV